MPKFNKTLNTSGGEINFRAEYNNNYLTIVIDKSRVTTPYDEIFHGIEPQIFTTEIFEGKISLKTEMDESGEIILPDWIRIKSDRKESEWR